jgi:ribosomal 50S subunit-associated protein YjgA (DUF615 family)
MYTSHEQARERQRALIAAAAQHRRARQVRTIGRAVRRLRRAEQHLADSWHEAARWRDELAVLSDVPRP